ncbi:hypothetical protein ACS0TY_006206 [Phlomoides rotata]
MATHRDRIEELERNVATMGEKQNVTNDKIDALALQVTALAQGMQSLLKAGETKTLRHDKNDQLRSSDDSPRGEATTSETGSENELNPTRGDNFGEQGTRIKTTEEKRRYKPKITCPTFQGTDPISWLSRVNQYFDLNDLELEERVRYAAYYLDGKANMWWQWLNKVYQRKGRLVRCPTAAVAAWVGLDRGFCVGATGLGNGACRGWKSAMLAPGSPDGGAGEEDGRLLRLGSGRKGRKMVVRMGVWSREVEKEEEIDE